MESSTIERRGFQNGGANLELIYLHKFEFALIASISLLRID